MRQLIPAIPRRTVPPAPPDLSAASRAAWPGLAADVVAACGGAAVDLAMLADLLRLQDRIADVAAAISREGVSVAGSTGQRRAHPLLAVEAQLRRDIAAGLDRLGLSPEGRRGASLLTIAADGRLNHPARGTT